MANTPKPRTTTRKPAAPRVPRKTAGGAATPAALAESATLEATGDVAIVRLRDQLADVLRSAREASEQAARDSSALIGEQIKAAETESSRLAEAAAGRVLAQAEAAEAAAAKVQELVASQVSVAEAKIEKAVAQMGARLADSISAAEAQATGTSRRIDEQLASQIAAKLAAVEAAASGLREQAEAILRSGEEAALQASAAQRKAFAGAESAGAAMIEGLARVQKEVADFVSARIRQDVEAQRDLLGCRSLEDVRDLQSRFVRGAMTQYSEELARLIKLGASFATRASGRAAD